MQENNLLLSQSFSMGNGNINHNLRQTKGRGIRQNGVMERRFINEYSVSNVDANKLLHDTIAGEVGNKLAMLNEKNIATKHPERVKTLQQWIEAQTKLCNGNITHDYVVQIGDKYTGCPFEILLDANGNMLDKNGNIIKEWDTRKQPAYKDGKPIESNICKKIKQVYKDFAKEFIQANPQARVLCYAIHGDENGGVHMHITVCWFSKTKNGIGIGLSKINAMKQQYEARGIKCKNTKKENPQTMWGKDMRALLKDVCKRNGIEKLDMENHEPHRTIPQFYKFKSKFCDELESKETQLEAKEDIIKSKEEIIKELEKKLKEKELELKEKEAILQEKELLLSNDIAKQEWYILKKMFPEMYQKIHNEYKIFKKSVNKGIDKVDKSIYNNR